MVSSSSTIKYRRSKAEEKSRISRGKIVNVSKKDSYEPKTSNDYASPHKKANKDLFTNATSADKLVHLQTSKLTVDKRPKKPKVSAFFGDGSLTVSPSKINNYEEDKPEVENNTKSVPVLLKRESFGMSY